MDNNEMFSFYKAALQGAITSPLCADYKNEWRGCGNDKDKLVKLVMRQQSLPYFITHCYNGKGLSKEYIQKTFADYINESTKKAVIFDADGVKGYTYSIYVAFEGVFKAVTDVLTMMWCNNTNVTISKAKCPILYVGCGSTVHLTCEGFNSPKIYLFDDSKVILDDVDETCDVIVYKYSPNAQVELGKYALGNVKVFDKQLKL